MGKAWHAVGGQNLPFYVDRKQVGRDIENARPIERPELAILR